jgi:hypothetical protein
MHLCERNVIHNKLNPSPRVSAFKQRLTDNCIMHHVMSVVTRRSVATSAAPLSRDKSPGLIVQSHNTASVLFPTSRDLVNRGISALNSPCVKVVWNMMQSPLTG